MQASCHRARVAVIKATATVLLKEISDHKVTADTTTLLSARDQGEQRNLILKYHLLTGINLRNK